MSFVFVESWVIDRRKCPKCKTAFEKPSQKLHINKAWPQGNVSIDEICSTLDMSGHVNIGPDAVHYILSYVSKYGEYRTCFRRDKLIGKRTARSHLPSHEDRNQRKWTLMDIGLCHSCQRKRDIVAEARRKQISSAKQTGTAVAEVVNVSDKNTSWKNS